MPLRRTAAAIAVAAIVLLLAACRGETEPGASRIRSPSLTDPQDSLHREPAEYLQNIP